MKVQRPFCYKIGPPYRALLRPVRGGEGAVEA